MKKYILTIVICVSIISEQFAQASLGIFVGLNVPRLTDNSSNPLSSGYTSRLGEAFGITSSLPLGFNFSLRADLLYSSEGGKRNGIQAIDATAINPSVPAGTYFYANYNNESILNYIELPVMLKFTVPVIKVYVDVGPYFGYLLNARQKTSGSAIIYQDIAETMPVVATPQSFAANTDVTGSIRKFNVGLTGGVGFSHGIGIGSIFLDVRGAYGLTNVQKYAQDGKSHNGYVLIALGYSVGL